MFLGVKNGKLIQFLTLYICELLRLLYIASFFFTNTKLRAFKIYALPLQRQVNLCSFSYWQHDLFAKIDHRCILFNRPLHRSVASDLMLLSMKCCTQLIFFDSFWRSAALAFCWTFFPDPLNFLNNSLSYLNTSSSPIQKSRTTTESGQGQDSPHIVVVRYLFLLILVLSGTSFC